MLKEEYPEHVICIKTGKWAQYLWTWRQSVIPNEVPRDFSPVIAFGTKDTCCQAVRERNVARPPWPYVKDPFYPLGSICRSKPFPYICLSVPVTSSKWYVKGCHGTAKIQKLRMCFSKTMSLRLRTINCPRRFLAQTTKTRGGILEVPAYWGGKFHRSRKHLNFLRTGLASYCRKVR